MVYSVAAAGAVASTSWSLAAERFGSLARRPWTYTPATRCGWRPRRGEEGAGLLGGRAAPGGTTTQCRYRVPLSGGPPGRVTPAEPKASWHDYRVSPDHRWAVWTRSSFAEPPVTELVRLPSHERVRTLQENRPRLEAIVKQAKTKEREQTFLEALRTKYELEISHENVGCLFEKTEEESDASGPTYVHKCHGLGDEEKVIEALDDG